MIKLLAVCTALNLFFINFFLQVVPPVVSRPIISDTVWSALIAAAAVVIVAWLNRRDNRRTEERMSKNVGIVKTEVEEVKTKVDNSQKEIKTLVENTDGKITELLDTNKQLSEHIGFNKGIAQSKIAHDEQSIKDEASNIAKGKIEGLAEAKAEQATGLLPAKEGEAVKVEIVQPEGSPAPVVIKEPKKPES